MKHMGLNSICPLNLCHISIFNYFSMEKISKCFRNIMNVVIMLFDAEMKIPEVENGSYSRANSIYYNQLYSK